MISRQQVIDFIFSQPGGNLVDREELFAEDPIGDIGVQYCRAHNIPFDLVGAYSVIHNGFISEEFEEDLQEFLPEKGRRFNYKEIKAYLTEIGWTEI
jgi:hypothetical protein